MSFGLGHGRTLDPAPGVVGVSQGDGAEYPPLPDDLLTNPNGARLDPRAWFDHDDRPFELEIGSGKGTFLVQQGGLQPQTNFLGIEWAGEFYGYAADRVRRHREAGSLENVRMLHADATEFLRWRCPSGICRVVHLYFSDPWPKTKHHKKRVIQHRFLAEAWRVLEAPAPDRPGGELRVVTDHDELWTWDLAHFEHWALPAADPDHPSRVREHAITNIPATPPDVSALQDTMPDPPFEEVPFDRPPSAGEGEVVGTNFERKFRREGRSFNATVLRKRAQMETDA